MNEKATEIVKGDENSAARQPPSARYLTPRVDIIENEEGWYLLADMPGVSQDDCRVEYEKGTLTIVGDTVEEYPKEHRLLNRGYSLGTYKRAFSIGDGVNISQAKAKMSNGVFRLELPKGEAAKPRKIPVVAE